MKETIDAVVQNTPSNDLKIPDKNIYYYGMSLVIMRNFIRPIITNVSKYNTYGENSFLQSIYNIKN